MKNFRAFKVVHIAWTETKPSHVKLVDLRSKKSVKLSYTNTSFTEPDEVAYEYLNSIGIGIVGRATGERGFLLFTENFNTPLTKQ